jgi:hypothetical protein
MPLILGSLPSEPEPAGCYVGRLIREAITNEGCRKTASPLCVSKDCSRRSLDA